MFNNIQFLNDLHKYVEKHNIHFEVLTYTEQMAVIRSMLIGISRSNKLKCKVYVCTYCGYIWSRPHNYCFHCSHSDTIFEKI